MLHPAAPGDPLAKLREHAAQALQLLDGAAVTAHPAATMVTRRRCNQAAHALQAAQVALRRLRMLLGPG